MDIRRMDVGSDTELAGWRSVLTATARAVDPSYTPRSAQSLAAMFRSPDPGNEHVRLVAVDGDQLVGIGSLALPREHNTSAAWIDVQVLPTHRRRGVGSTLLDELEASAPASRTHLHGGATVTAHGWTDSDPVRFAEHRGYTTHSHAVVRRLALPLDPRLLATLAVDISPYRVETHVDGVPHRYFPDYGALMGLLDVDAPTGELEWEPSQVSWEDYLAGMHRCAASGERVVESLAIAPDGQLVGYSDLVVGAPGRPVAQGGTLVLAEHRRRGLARALKLANLEALLHVYQDNPFVETSNNAANTAMAAVNEHLGFVPTLVAPEFLKVR